MSDEPKISQRYRELGSEEPPRHVDEAILAASRRAADVRPAPLVAPTGRRRWYFPVAAAAVIVLAVSVAVQVEREQPEPEVAVLMKRQVEEPKAQSDVLARQEQEMRAPSAAAQAPAGKKSIEPKAPAAAAESPGEKAPASVGMREEQAMRAPVPAAPPPAPVEPSGKAFPYAPEIKQEQQAQDRVVAQAQRADEAARDRRASAATPLGAISGRVLADEPPEKWVERIAELRKAGQHDEADKLLEEFRKRFPDYKVPESALRK